MATDSISDVWTELIASRRQRQKCADDVEELKRTCEKECGKKHIVECEQCYKQVLERMRQRYADSSEKEWFTERRAFISELDGAFNDAKNYHKNVEAIEASIEAEKEAWYRWVFRKNPEYLQVADHSPALQQLRDLLDDPECSRDELVTAMWRGVGKPDDWEAKLEEFLPRVDALNGKDDELRKMYLPEFFLDEAGQPLEHAQGCFEEFRDDKTKTIQDIATSIALDNQRARSAQPQRDNQVKRLDELRRAKTAFEQNRLHAKRLLSQAQHVKVRDEFRTLPPCVVCGNLVLREDVISCSLCQTILQLGGDIGLTLYCTDECFQEGHVSMILIISLGYVLTLHSKNISIQSMNARLAEDV